jgi:transposase InsO family protein
VNAFIDEYRTTFGVEPICRVLQVAPSAYWRHAARRRDPALRSARARRDEALLPEIDRMWQENWQVYGARKVWLQMKREDITVARCTVARLMKRLGLQGARRGRRVRTTVVDTARPCPQDLVQRRFTAQRPDQLWLVDFTYVSTWQGWLYVAFVTDAYARRIVGWQTSSSMTTDFVLDALEQALAARRPDKGTLTHHGDRGSQYLSLRYSERLLEAGVAASVGSAGDALDNALAETINGLYKTEVIKRIGPWKSRQQLELATLRWVHWFNTGRLLESIGDIPPAEKEANYWSDQAIQRASAEAFTLTA